MFYSLLLVANANVLDSKEEAFVARPDTAMPLIRSK
jgi:hypothetical protein